MGELVRQKRYQSNGSTSREKENFSYTLFSDIDFRNDSDATSFFRSDFRGAKFINVVFHLNNFDRADFISCVFIDCKFLQVDIAASEMKNCYFQNVEFVNNRYNNTSIQECTFQKCNFREENFLINMKNCEFNESTLNSCKFERSTTENITYNMCNISSVDYANMHAERYRFKSCIMTDIDIDICYIFGYFFFDTSIRSINIIYMGDRIEFTKDNMLNKFASNLWIQRRYYEFINANIIFDNLTHVIPLIKNAFNELVKNTDYSGRLEALNIFEILHFYTMCNQFDFKFVTEVMNFFDDFDWEQFSFENKLLYLSQTHKYKLYLSETAYDSKFIESANGEISFVTFYCNTDDYDNALDLIKKCLNEICETYGLTSDFEIIESRKGSWIITVALVASCALLLPVIFKRYIDIAIEINTKRKISKRISDRLERKNLKLEDLKQIADIAKSAGIVAIAKEGANSVDLSSISKILEMVKIGV